jgi:membrane protease YdiL (CAAX protease family)
VAGVAPKPSEKRLIVFELALVAAVFVADAYGFIPFSKTPVLAVLAFASLALRRASLRAIGFRAWRSWPATFLIGIAVGAGMEAFQLFVSQPAITELTGQPPDLRPFEVVRGNVQYLAIGLALAWLLAAFGEEFFYRGYLLNRFRDFFRSGAAGTAIALIASSAIFGSAHAYQGMTGVIDEGLMGVILGIAYLAFGRSIVVPIVAHGVQDTIDLVLLYLGKYPG